jgi:hypothetical protein
MLDNYERCKVCAGIMTEKAGRARNAGKVEKSE